ncbi:MAG: GDSL-type esterase/lipase family protein [Oscillospiraceae bacterium]|nr:GDSL-type esterase/lipase family protein [Oscillospiraceae bacterium]MDY2510947.1 GDSL-type esterase/lipase family protein [Ruminococcus callidus]
MKTILCFGDSNTYGYHPETKKRYVETIRWTGRLQNQIRPYGWRVIEEGLCGRTTMLDGMHRENRNGAAILPMLLETHAPLDAVILMLGTNDCKTQFHATPESIGDGIRKLILQIRETDSNLPILLISPIHLAQDIEKKDPAFSDNSVLVSHALKSVYAAIAEQESCLFFAASDYAEPSEIDGEHLDAEGHQHLAEQIFKVLQPLLHGKE